MRRGILLLVVVFVPLLNACALNPPRIVSISPSREVTDVPANQMISVSFDRPMNHDSVERRFDLSPAISGCRGSRNCRFAWTGNTLMFIHTHVNFALSTEYTVSMHSGYADASGQQNTLDHSWRFKTEGPPTLTAVDPSDNASSVAPDRNIVLTFSRPMRADSMQAAVQLSPDVPFLLRSRPGGDGSQFEVIPTAVLQPNQSYTVTVNGPLDVHDNAIVGRVQSRFRTGTLSISRKIGYLVGQPAEPAFAVGIVDPHADAFLGRSTPKLIYRLSAQSQLTDAILSFDWSPDGQRLVVVEAPRNAVGGPIQIVDLASGTVIRPGISGSDVYWSSDGTIIYLANGSLRRFRPTTLEDVALTDLADGRVIGPVALSPDGKSIAYSTADAQGTDHLWILNLDLRTRYRPIGLDDPADHPAWSPNGTKLAFRRLTATGPELWVYDLSASGSSAYRRGGTLDITGAAWLNDNSTLFAATGSGTSAVLYRVNIFSASEAGGVVKVTGSKDAPNGSTPTAPAYDRRVGFVGLVDQLPQIYVMNGDGSRPQPLTEWEADYPYTGQAPNWTPTG
ncbi:MAG TPA: Ig-like domain-containing protein [Candidatus Dormibacteraeota bacterium]|nr:Ig-like domain-containing protein [Candidatus Dormibacteraeota bacterium]